MNSALMARLVTRCTCPCPKPSRSRRSNLRISGTPHRNWTATWDCCGTSTWRVATRRAHRTVPEARAPPLVVGIMSGTSLDGADAVIAEPRNTGFAVCGHAYEAFAAELRGSLLS